MAIIESNDFGYIEKRKIDNWAARYAEELIKEKDLEIQEHKKSMVLDHADHCVTREKLSQSITDELDTMKESVEREHAGRIGQIEEVRKDMEDKADAKNTDGGFAGGLYSISKAGGAIGCFAQAHQGGAVGWGAKAANGFSGGQNAVCEDTTGVIDAIQLGTGINDKLKTFQVYNYHLMDADGTIPEERIPQLKQKADMQNMNGGFCAGEGNHFTGVGVSIGRNAVNVEGVAIGDSASNQTGAAIGNHSFSGGGGAAVGTHAAAYHGGAVGQSAVTGDGGAVGKQAISGSGFSGGSGAVTGKDINNLYLNTVQLGQGINNRENTLQVYNYRLMDADGSIPMERMPEWQNRFASKFAGDFINIPSVNSRDMVIQLKSPLISTRLLSVNEDGGYVFRIAAQTTYEFYLHGEKKAGTLKLQNDHTLDPAHGMDQTLAYLQFQYETGACGLTWHNSTTKPAQGVCNEEAKTVSDIHWFDLKWDGQYKNLAETALAVNERGTVELLVTQSALEALEQRIAGLEEEIRRLQA